MRRCTVPQRTYYDMRSACHAKEPLHVSGNFLSLLAHETNNPNKTFSNDCSPPDFGDFNFSPLCMWRCVELALVSVLMSEVCYSIKEWIHILIPYHMPFVCRHSGLINAYLLQPLYKI
jgi:hypothetical protein